MAEISKFDLREIQTAHTALLKFLVIAPTYTYERSMRRLRTLFPGQRRIWTRSDSSGMVTRR